MGHDSYPGHALATDRHPARYALVALLCALLAIGLCQSSRAQDAGDDDEEEENAAAAVPVPIRMNVVNIERNFDMWVFGQFASAAAAQQHLKSILDFRVDRIDEACGLSDAQKKKLVLGGQGDIKRFLDRVDSTRRQVLAVKDVNQNLNIAFQQAQPLQRFFNSQLFSDESMFHKILAATLDEQQLAKVEARDRQTREAEYRAIVGWTVHKLEQNLGLSDRQRHALFDLILQETRAPKQIGRMRHYVIMLQTSTISDRELEPIFDDLQWPAFTQQLNQAKMLRQALLQNGYVPDDGKPLNTDKKPVGVRPDPAAKPRTAAASDKD